MDPNDPSQSTPIVPSIDPNIGDIQEMDLGAIVGAYNDIGQSFNQMGQNSVADIANRQQQLIGNNFSSPLEGPMGNYNESTYIEPAVTSAQSTIKQIGTQVALNEGIRRSEEAAEEKLRETQKKYNEWVAEQNRKAAEAAQRAANSARSSPGGWGQVHNNTVSQETLDKHKLSLEDFAALDQESRKKLLREDYDRRAGIDWDYKGDIWYKTVDQLYKEFGVSGDAAKDERTGKQTQANKDFWARKDVGKRFGEIHAEFQGFGNGAQVMQQRQEYVKVADQALEKWINPKTPEEKAISFDKVMQAIEVTVPVKQATTEEKELGAASQIEERIKQYERVSENNLSEDEKREMARLAEDFRTKKKANVDRLNELLNKAGSHTTLKQVDQNFFERMWSPGKFEVQTGTKIVNEKINAAKVVESALGLTSEELKGMREIKDADSKEFERIMKISHRVLANNYITISDGQDKADNYFRNAEGELELAGINEVIIHYMPSAENDPALADLRKYLKDPLYMEAVRKAGSGESNSEEDKQKLKRFEEAALKFRQNQLMVAAVAEGRGYTDNSDIYSAVLYEAGSDNDTARGEIAGRQIRDWLNEFKGLARDDQKAMSERYLDLLDKANSQQGGYVNVDGTWTPLSNEQDGNRSSIGAPRKHFQDLSNEQAMALFMIIKKEQDAGEFSNNFLDKHEGADSGVGDKMWHAIRSAPNMYAAGFWTLTSGIADIAGQNSGQYDDLVLNNWGRVVSPTRGQAGGAQRYDQHAYDTFRNILDVQYTADTGEEGWYGKDSDTWVAVKRFGGDISGFGADLVFGLVSGGVAKTVGMNLAKKNALKIAGTYGEQLGKNVGESVASSAIVKNADGSSGIRTVSGQFKTFEEIGSDLATAAMNGRSATNYLKELSPTAFKGLEEKQVIKMLDDALPKGLRGVQARHRIWQANLRRSNADIAGYTSLMMAGVSSKAIAQASPQALRAAVQIIKEGGKDGGSVFSAASRRQVVADAEKKIVKMSDELARGTNASGTALTASEMRSLRARIAVQRRRINNPGSPAIAREYGFQSAATVARKLVDRAAEVGASGGRMSKYDVARFLAREGSDSARKEAFIKRFMRDEGIGNALFAWGDQRNAVDLETGEHRWEDPDYIAEAIITGTALGAGIHLAGGPTQSIKRQLVNDRIQRLRNSLVKNGIDPDNKAHVRKMNEIARLTRYADRLMDDAMMHAGNPDQVALFKKTAEEAKQASRAVLDSLQEVKGFADSSVSKSVDELMSAISGRAGYETRLMRTMTTLRAESHVDWVRRTSTMRNLASIDSPEVNARIMKSGFDSLAAARSAAKKELSPKRANEAMDKGLVDGLVAHGVNRKVAEQEIKALRKEYDDKWKLLEAKAKEGVISLDSFGGRKRGGYISPAGMTHTMVDDLGPAEWGLIFERKVNADVAKPTIERQADMGKVISDWLDGKRSAGKGVMKVRNPEGMNLVTSLQTYSNMVNSEIYLRTLDENIIRNGDVIVIGAKNVQNAVKEDKAYYTARIKELNTELKSSKVGRNQLADTPEITAKRAEVERLQARLNDLEGVGLGERSVSIAAQVLNVEPNEFASVYKRIAAMLKANKEAILKGGDGNPQLEAFTDGKGNYSRDSVIEATFRHFDNVQPLYDATGGAAKEAKSQYMRGVDDVAQATLRHRVGDTDYSKSLVNEAMRNFAETDAGAGIYGLGDVVQYVAERTPLSKKPGDGLDSLEWRKVSNALTRSKADEALSTVKADYEPGSAIHTLAEALDEPRDTQVRLRGSEADLEADMYGEALEYRLTKMEQFERFSTAEKQEALDALDFLLREGSEKGPAKKSEATLNRQFNLQEIVAKNNLDDPSFDESPMFSRITDPETPNWSADPVTDLGTVKIGKKSVPAAALTENGIIMPGAPAVDSMAEIRGSMDEWADRLSSDINNSLKKSLGEDNFDGFTISIDPRSAIGSSGDDLGPFGMEIRRLLDDLREARAEGRITAEQHDAAEVGIREALGDTSAGSRTGLDKEIDFDQLIEERLIEGIESGRPLRRDAPTAETTIPRTPGARLSAFYNELGAEDFASMTRAAKESLKQQRSELSAMIKANKEVHKSQIAKFDKSLEPKLKELAEMKDRLANVKAAGSNPAAYVNRNGMKFIGETNNLQGYSAATTLTEVEQAKRTTQEGFHPIENRSIRRENKRKGAVSKASLQKRQEVYDEITEMVRGSKGANSAIDDSDIMIHQGLARVKSMEQKQFSSTQGFQKAALATAGFAKAVQNVQLSAGYSRYNAYSFRYLVSAMMSNPLDAVPLLKTLRESRSIESVNKFYMQNQGLFMDVTQKTGDPFYIQSFTDSVSQRAAFDSGYLSRALKVGEGNAKWHERMDLNVESRRKELADEGNLDSWRNAPKYDSTTAVAVESGAARRTAKTVANFVEATWDDPTFKRFMPVLSGTLFLQNYKRAIQVAKKRQLKRVTAEAKKNGGQVNPADLMLDQADIDNAIMMAHVRTKIFFHPAAARSMSRAGLKTLMAEGSYDNAAINRFISKLTREQIEEITDANQGMNAGKIVSSLFFAMHYKATQIGQIANGIAGVGQLGNAAARGTNVSFTQQGSRNLAFSMLTLTAAAMIFNEINGRTQAWDDPERLLTNLNEIGKFRLGDGDGTPAIDPFFSQFTLLNSLARGAVGLAGVEGGTGVGKSNPHRGIGLPGTPLYVRGELPFRLGAIQDELTSNLLSPFKAMAEVVTNNTYFGGNVWEHATKLDGTPNANYDPGRNLMAGITHLLGLDTTNRYVKGDNPENDKISWVGGSGLVQHPYIEAYKAWQEGDYGKATFAALELPLKWDNLPGRARSSLNGFVVDTIGQLKQEYDAVVKANPGDKAKIDAAYESFTKQAVDVVADWSAKNEDVLEQDPKLIAAAQRILTGFFADHYDDNLMKIQSAYWKASIESGLGADFGWEPLPGESEDDMAKRIDKVNKYFFAERDKERDARDELKRLGFDVGDRWGSSDEYDKYRNVHRNVIAQFEKATKGRINGFENLKAAKKNYEDRIKLVDEIYTNKAKARAKKTELAEEHNQSVFDLLAPYVEQYGPYTLEMYDRSGGRGLGDIAAELLIIPADVLWKYGTNRNPEKNYLKDHFGVGWSNNSNLPSDAAFQKSFNKMTARINRGEIASASKILDDIIKNVQHGKYGVTGKDWARTLRYREIINGRIGL